MTARVSGPIGTVHLGEGDVDGAARLGGHAQRTGRRRSAVLCSDRQSLELTHAIVSFSLLRPADTLARAASSRRVHDRRDVGVTPIQDVAMDHGQPLLQRQLPHRAPQILIGGGRGVPTRPSGSASLVTTGLDARRR